MTRDDVIRMAREAGFVTGSRDYADGSGAAPYVQSVATASFLGELERFSALVAAAEREACAQACDALASGVPGASADPTDAAAEVAYEACAEAIRARGAA